MIYFIAPIGGGPIKIGLSRRPAKRLTQMQPHSPFLLEILLVFPGNEVVERDLHLRFSDEHAHGEWFHPSDRLLLFVSVALAIPGNRAETERARAGLGRRFATQGGPVRARSRLSDEQVREVRALILRGGMSVADIARSVGGKYQSVRNVALGKTYRS